MKSLKIVLAGIIIAMLAVVSVSAATVTYDLVPFDEDANKWEVTFTYDLELDVDSEEYSKAIVGGYTTYFTFNSEKLVLADASDYSAITDYATAVNAPVVAYPHDGAWGRNSKYYGITDAKANTWVVLEDGKTVQGYICALTQETVFEPNGSTVLSVAFKLADGVTVDDLVSTDFTIESVMLDDTVNKVYYGYQYTKVECDETLTVVNNVVPAPVVVAEEWIAGAGYPIDGTPSGTTKTETSATKVFVAHGGYYATADALAGNWGGVSSKEKVTVDGLEVEVTYSSIPTSEDCWMYIGVLDNPSIFIAGTPYNPGYVNLIRYGQDNLAVHGVDSWSGIGNYGAGTGFFAIEEGDALRACFDKNSEGTYDVTYIKNGTEYLEGPKGLALSDTAYVVVSASCKNSAKDSFAYTVDTAPAEVKVAKIPVAAGDTVYDADGVVAEVEADGTYNVLAGAEEVMYYVNSGYTAQKFYVVSAEAENGYTEYADYEDAVLGHNGVEVRQVEPQGIRFKGTVKNETATEYGFIMTAESAYNALPEGYVLDMDLVAAGDAVKGVAYNGADIDKFWSRDENTTIITGVFHGIPETAEAYKTVIVSRPYAIVDGEVIYGEETSCSLYEVAKKIYNVTGYESAWEYAKEIIEVVEGTEDVDEPANEIIIDVGSLYE